MRNVIVAVAVLVIGVLSAVPVTGQTFFQAVIDGAQEVPPSGSPGTGLGCLTLNPNPSGTLSFEISFSGLLSPEVAAHIHGPAAAGSTAGVLFPLPLGSPKIGATVKLTNAQKTDLLAGLYYINIHTGPLPGGAIRGQILPGLQCTVPVEESTWGHIKALYELDQ